MSGLVARIQQALEDTDLVLGWAGTGAGGTAAPARFHTPAEAEQAVFDSTCVHNLAVHLPRLKDRAVGIVAKPCDARSVIELVIEREVERERVQVISVDCPGILDVKMIWRSFGYGAAIEDDDDELKINGNDAARVMFLRAKCQDCEDNAGHRPSPDQSELLERNVLAAEFHAMSAAERREFWREQYSRCIRCYACREACPMCYCRDVCIMQTRDPHWIGGDVTDHEAEMMQLIRVSHLAGRCTGCGECERACPAGIPLMLLMEEQNRVVQEMFGYSAGTDPEGKPPLLTFSLKGDGWGNE